MDYYEAVYMCDYLYIQHQRYLVKTKDQCMRTVRRKFQEHFKLECGILASILKRDVTDLHAEIKNGAGSSCEIRESN